MREIPKTNEIYRHFKGNLYRIVTLAKHSETGETLVIYQALYGDYTVYARELSMFLSKVDRVKYPDADQDDRFVLLPQIVGQEQQSGSAEIKSQQPGSAEISPQQADGHQFPSTAGETVPEEGEAALDPLLISFLDADTYREKLNLLVALHARITDDMINTMAVSLDVEVNDGEIEDRYEALRNCLLTLEKYECNRLR